ncbi:hypothetical protein D3C76_1266900 [compost metagenome]
MVVVERQRPEIRLRNPLGQRYFVGLGAVEVILVGIDRSEKVLRADPCHTHGHSRCDAGHAIEVPTAGVHLAIACGWEGLGTLARNHWNRRFELIAGNEKRVKPSRVGVVVPTGITRLHEQAA